MKLVLFLISVTDDEMSVWRGGRPFVARLCVFAHKTSNSTVCYSEKRLVCTAVSSCHTATPLTLHHDDDDKEEVDDNGKEEEDDNGEVEEEEDDNE